MQTEVMSQSSYSIQYNMQSIAFYVCNTTGTAHMIMALSCVLGQIIGGSVRLVSVVDNTSAFQSEEWG